MRKKVLICDDDVDLLEVTSLALEGPNRVVETLSNMDHLLDKVKTFQPDIILMDLWMPLLDGEQATRLLQGEKSIQHIPIVLFSASPRLPTIAEELGTFYINKPFDISQLREVIDRHALTSQI